jgi:hypothetical protein
MQPEGSFDDAPFIDDALEDLETDKVHDAIPLFEL